MSVSVEVWTATTSSGVPLDQVICVAGGEKIALSDDVRVSVFPSQHSCVWSHQQMVQAGDECIGDLGVTWQEQQERFARLVERFATGPPTHECRLSAAG